VQELIANFRVEDAVDVGVIAFLVYHTLDLIRGTRAARMLLGLGVVFLVFFTSQLFDLYTVNWVLDNFLSSILLVIVVIFQNDIRRALTQVGSGPFFGGDHGLRRGDVEEVVRAAVTMATKRVGALVVFERDVGLSEYIEGGTAVDAAISRELIVSIFQTSSPVHDGAIIISTRRIAAAGCFLPLTTNPNVSKALGTRHRAAIGVTEETDAVVVVVSEEDGRISLVRSGRLTRDLDAANLREKLETLLV
jgi:diadenylate cyclase